MSKKQGSSKKKEEVELTTGKLDKTSSHKFPKSWTEKEDLVVVFQEALVDVFGNGDKQAVRHSQPIQAYPKQTFDRLYITPDGAKTNGFEDMGIKVTPLHDTSEVDEDIQYAVNPPVAETATNEFDEAAKKAAQMVKDGETNTPAEEFTEKSQEKAEEIIGEQTGETTKRGRKPNNQ